jgi:MscS family membrane protein
MEVAKASQHVVADPEPRVRFRAFGESSLDFQLLAWIDEPVLQGRALDELNTAVYHRFAENDIQIPFPQRDVNLKETRKK